MKIVLTVDSLAGEFGGPSRSVPTLARALAALGVDVELWTLPGRERVPGVTVRRFGTTRQLACALVEAKSKSLLVHDNGLWRPFNWLVTRTTRSNNIPFVVSPRGMLDPLSLQSAALKKKLAWLAYQRRLLEDASLLHATAQREVESIRTNRLRNPVVVQPNGIDFPALVPDRPSCSRTVLFLSRLSPQKGIEVLLDAWAGLRPAGWRLRIAGDGNPRYVESVRARALKAGPNGSVEWLGELDDQQKWKVYAAADVFVLPSFSENFGIVVAEALAAGLPVITTTGTPWTDLAAHECGVCVPPDVPSLREALQSLIALTHQQRIKMGTRGRALIEDRFSWSGIAKGMVEAYEAALTNRGLDRYL